MVQCFHFQSTPVKVSHLVSIIFDSSSNFSHICHFNAIMSLQNTTVLKVMSPLLTTFSFTDDYAM